MRRESGAELKLWEKVHRASVENKVSQHLYFAQKYSERYPKNPWGWMSYADVLGSLARYEEALKCLVSARDLLEGRHVAPINTQFGHLYYHWGLWLLSEKHYRIAMSESNRSANCIFLGAVLAKQGCFDEALACYRQAIDRDLGPVEEAHYNAGLIYRAQERYEEAHAQFKRALELCPDYPEAKEARQDLVALLRVISGERSSERLAGQN